MKIVLDTNCLIPVLIPGSFGHDIWQAFRTGRYTLCVSTEILLEYEEIIIHMTGNREYAALVIETIANALIPPIVTQISQIYKSRRN
jgi:predicted nucleic acid-binding protein